MSVPTRRGRAGSRGRVDERGTGVPRPPRSARRAATPRVAAGLLAVLILLVGCSNQSDANYTRVETGKLTVDRPTGWGQTMTVDAPWTTGFQPAPRSVEQIQFSGDFGDYVTAAQGVGDLIGRAQVGLQQFTVVETRDIEVKGATTAQVVRYTITDNQKSQLSGEWIVAARWPDPQSVAVSVLTPQFDPDLERQVIDSMRFRPS